MKPLIPIALLLLLLTAATAGWAAERSIAIEQDSIVRGGPTAGAASSRDTLHLIGPWGSGAVVNGQFETESGAPSWNGWTHRDLTQRSDPIWHVDTYNVVDGVYSAWCGEIQYPACSVLDVAGGYGSNYEELLVWRHAVEHPGSVTVVDVSAVVNHNTEPGYDYTHLGYLKADQSIQYLWSADGEGEQVAVSGSVTYVPGDYVGEAGDEVAIAWFVQSDGGWDDSDCSYYGDGALQVDDISITVNHWGESATSYTDFEDGTLGDWQLEFRPGVGDYAHLLGHLADEDPCAVNLSTQVCFVADEQMLLERGLPVQECWDWCYGPFGYIVNNQGGARGPEAHLYNVVESPVIAWPGASYNGAGFLFDVYKHENFEPDGAGMFYVWAIRSTAGGDIEEAQWRDRNYLYFGGPSYVRGGDEDVSDLIEPGATEVQVQLGVYEVGYVFGWDGANGTPAPYFDNVSLVAFEHDGPSLFAEELKLAQDAFPADGHLHDGADLGLNDVRFDMAANISPEIDQRIDPGDSIVVSLQALGAGATLVTQDVNATVTAPRLYFSLKMNLGMFPTSLRLPVGSFTCDSDGSVLLDGQITDITNGVMNGWVEGAPAEANGVPHPRLWMFDLPDQDFLYPGDVLHYRIEAWSAQAGTYTSASLPADLSGFGVFRDALAYDPLFVVHALPSVQAAGGYQANVLFWNDQGDRGGRNEWLLALHQLGYIVGYDFDIFYTNDAEWGVSNGLGGKATPEQIAGYDIILYTCGNLVRNTLVDPDYDADAGDDIGLLDDWLSAPDHHLLLTGDNLVTDLWSQNTAASRAFVSDRMGLTWYWDDLRVVLGGTFAPVVVPVDGNPVFQDVQPWLVYGGCPSMNEFDAVTVLDAERLAVFERDPSSSWSAATLKVGASGSMVVSLPYDFMYVWQEELAGKLGQQASIATRVIMLRSILAAFGAPAFPAEVVAVPLPEAAFSAGAFPNPFNPSTRIEYSLPRAGNLRVKIFDVGGKLVRTLIDERVAAGAGHVMWDGTDQSGKSAASGVYFYEVRTDEAAQIDKLMLIK